jgi:GT2 family glycosyltransferase
MSVTIAVVPRDRFSKTAQTIRSIFEVTPEPYRLVVVDAGSPRRYRLEAERAVCGRRSAEILRSDHYLNANEAKNWVLREVTDGEYLAFIENDNIMHPEWLDRLIEACEAEGAGVARPMIFERKIFRTYPHFDQRLDRIERIRNARGPGYRFRPRTRPLKADVTATRQRTDVLETHGLLFRRSVFSLIGELDERINTRQEVDLALQLCAAAVPIVFEPAARITYFRPPPVRQDERAYFLMRWDCAAALASHRLIEEKWNVEGLPTSLDFVRHRKAYVSYGRYAAYYLRHEMGPYLRYDLGERVRYGLYRSAAGLPRSLREPTQRALYP